MENQRKSNLKPYFSLAENGRAAVGLLALGAFAYLCYEASFEVQRLGRGLRELRSDVESLKAAEDRRTRKAEAMRPQEAAGSGKPK